LVIFIFGGVTGIINASYSLNNVVHNTAWLPAHFHQTVAGPVFLSFIGMSLYLVVKLTAKEVKLPAWNVWVPYIWAGILTFSMRSCSSPHPFAASLFPITCCN
jgi:cytochrome c oxidase subunit I